MPKHVGAIGQITIKVERGLLRRYRAQCVLRGTTPTANVAKLIVAQLHTWVERTATKTVGEGTCC